MIFLIINVNKSKNIYSKRNVIVSFNLIFLQHKHKHLKINLIIFALLFTYLLKTLN